VLSDLRSETRIFLWFYRLLLWIFVVATIAATFGILYMSPHTKLFTTWMNSLCRKNLWFITQIPVH